MATIASYKQSPVWQQAMQLTMDIYQFTATLPAVERLNLSMQLQQLAVSIPTKVAAASKSSSKSQLKQTCLDTLASLAEMETLLIIAGQQYSDINIEPLLKELDDVEHLFRALLKRLSTPAKTI